MITKEIVIQNFWHLCLILGSLINIIKVYKWKHFASSVFYVNCIVRSFFPIFLVQRVSFVSSTLPLLFFSEILTIAGDIGLGFCLCKTMENVIKLEKNSRKRGDFHFNILYVGSDLNNLTFSIVIFSILPSWSGVVRRDSIYEEMNKAVWSIIGVYFLIWSFYFCFFSRKIWIANFFKKFLAVLVCYILYSSIIVMPSLRREHNYQVLHQLTINPEEGFFETLLPCRCLSQGHTFNFRFLNYFGTFIICPFLLSRLEKLNQRIKTIKMIFLN